MKQSANTRSINSRIGRGILHTQAGSTEVTTIESYDLTSALELNLNSAVSKEIGESVEGSRGAGDPKISGVNERISGG